MPSLTVDKHESRPTGRRPQLVMHWLAIVNAFALIGTLLPIIGPPLAVAQENGAGLEENSEASTDSTLVETESTTPPSSPSSPEQNASASTTPTTPDGAADSVPTTPSSVPDSSAPPETPTTLSPPPTNPVPPTSPPTTAPTPESSSTTTSLPPVPSPTIIQSPTLVEPSTTTTTLRTARQMVSDISSNIDGTNTSVVREGQTLTVVATRSETTSPLTATVSIPELEATDIVGAIPTHLTFASGKATASFELEFVVDNLIEGVSGNGYRGERLTISIEGNVGGPQTYTVDVYDVLGIPENRGEGNEEANNHIFDIDFEFDPSANLDFRKIQVANCPSDVPNSVCKNDLIKKGIIVRRPRPDASPPITIAFLYRGPHFDFEDQLIRNPNGYTAEIHNTEDENGRIVEFTILNADEPGIVTFTVDGTDYSNALDIDVGSVIAATVSYDPDGEISGTTWQWERGPETSREFREAPGSTWTTIPSATASTYTVTADDEGRYLRAIASYNDSFNTDTKTSVAHVLEHYPVRDQVYIGLTRGQPHSDDNRFIITEGLPSTLNYIVPHIRTEDVPITQLNLATVPGAIAIDKNITYDWSISHIGTTTEDFKSNSGTGRIALGWAYQTNSARAIKIDTENDKEFEGDEDFIVRISNLRLDSLSRLNVLNISENHGSIRLTLMDNDTAPKMMERPRAPNPPTLEVVSSSSLTVSWDAPMVVGPEITSYSVQYKEIPSTQTTSPPGFGPPIVVTGLTSTTLTGLTANTEYEVRVAARNSIGLGPYSEGARGTPGNRPPTFNSNLPTRFGIEENSAVGTEVFVVDINNMRTSDSAVLDGSDLDSNTVTIALRGSDADHFEVGENGVIRFIGGTNLDHEDESSFTDLEVTISDGKAADDTEDPAVDDSFPITIHVLNIDEIVYTVVRSELTEGSSTRTATITVTIDGGIPLNDINVPILIKGTVSDSDYTLGGPQYRFLSGTTPAVYLQAIRDTTGVVTITIEDDNIVEGDEILAFSLGAPSYNLSPITVSDVVTNINIIDNDTADITVSTTQTEEVEENVDSDLNTVTFTIATDKLVDGPVMVDWEITGEGIEDSDFTGDLTGTATIPLNTMMLAIEVEIADDILPEGAETFTFTLVDVRHSLAGRSDDAVALGDKAEISEQVTIAQSDRSLPPTNVIATAGRPGTDPRQDADQTIEVTWQPPSSGTPPEGYRIRYRNATDNGDYQGINEYISDPAARTHIIPRLTAGKTYEVQVSSVNALTEDYFVPETALQVVTAAAITASIEPVTSPEEGNPATATISLTGPRSEPTSVQLTTTGGTATSGDGSTGDYTALTGVTVEIPIGGTTVTREIVTRVDNIVEANETLTVAITGSTGIAHDDTPETVTILDDDTATVTLSVSRNEVEEDTVGANDNTVTFTATLNGQVDAEVTVPWTITNVSAEDADYSTPTGLKAGEFVFTENAGTTATQQVEVTINDDMSMEDAQSFRLDLGTPTYNLGTRTGVVTLGSTSSQTVTIAESDPFATVPTITSFVKGDGSGNDQDRAVTVTWDPGDVPNITGYIVEWAQTPDPGTNPVWRQIPINDPSIKTRTVRGMSGLEPETSYMVRVGTRAENTIPAYATSNSIETDPRITASISLATTPTEGSPSVVTIQLTGTRSEATTVVITTTGDTASAGTDYTALSGVNVNIPKATDEVTRNVATVPDNVTENDESFWVSLTDSAMDIDHNTVRTPITIKDDDDAVLSVSVDSAQRMVNEPTTDVVFTLSLSNPVSQDVTVVWAITGVENSDYETADRSPVTFSAATSETSKTVTVDILDDDVSEMDEKLIFTLSNLQVGLTRTDAVTLEDPPSETVTILSNDPLAPQPTAIRVEAGIPGPTDADPNRDTDRALTVFWTAPVTNPPITLTGYTIRWGEDPGDGSEPSWTYIPNIAAVDTSHQITDTTISPDQTYQVQITSTAAGHVDNYPITSAIRTTSPAITISVEDNTVFESETSVSVNVRLDRPLSTEVTATLTPATGTASATDFDTAAQAVIVAAGSVTSTVTVDITPDSVVEPNEAFTVSLDNPSTNITAGDTEATVTINDDDTATVSLPNTTITVAEDTAGGPANDVTFTATLTGEVAAEVSVPWTITNGTADEDDYTTPGDGALTGDFTFSANSGATSTDTLTVTIDIDDIGEGAETFTLTLANPTVDLGGRTGAVTLGTSSQEVTISASDADTVGPDNVVAELGDGSDAGSDDNDKDRSITVTWEEPTTSDTITGYIIEYRTNPAGGTPSDWGNPVTVDDLDSSYTITGLDPETRYDVRVGTVATDRATVFTEASNNPQTTTAPITATIEATNPDEGAPSTVTVRLSGSRSMESTVVISTNTEGTATPGTAFTEDFTPLSAVTVSIPAGQTVGSTTPTIATRDDDIVEADETVVVEIDSTTGEITAGSPVTITITDVDTAEIDISVNDTDLAEGVSGNDTATITVSLPSNRRVDADVMVPINVTVGDADDYMLSNTSVTILTGQRQATATISIDDDNLVEGNESLTIGLGTPTSTLAAGKVTSTTDTRRIFYSDSDKAQVSLSVDKNTVDEDVPSTTENTVTFTATLNQSVEAEVLVTWVLGGAAVRSSDYTSDSSSGSFRFTPESPINSEQSITLTITNDNVGEAAEDITLTLSSPRSNPELIGNTDAITITGTNPLTVTINPSDPIAVIDTVEAGDSNGRDTDSALTVIWTAPVTTDTITEYTVQYAEAIAGGGVPTVWTDDGTVLADADLTHTIDDLDPATTYHVRVLTTATDVNPTPTDGTHTGTTAAAITVGFDSSTASTVEGSGAELTVVLSGARSEAVTVQVATAGVTATEGVDFPAYSVPVTFMSGSISETFTVATTADEVVEADETFTVTLSSPTAGVMLGTESSTVTITDDDDAAVRLLLSEMTVTEGGSDGSSDVEVTVSVSLDNMVDAVVMVPITVTGGEEGVDFSLSGSPITIPVGMTAGSATATLTVLDDDIVEAQEMLVVGIGTVTAGALAADIDTAATDTVTVDDNDMATLSISVDQDTRAEGETSMVTVTLDKQVDAEITVPIAVADTDTAEDEDYTLTGSAITFMANTDVRTDSSYMVSITDDRLVESQETLTLRFGDIVSTLSGSIIAASTQDITINDDDSAEISVGVDVAAVKEDVTSGTENTVTFTIETTEQVDVPVTVDWTIAGAGIDADDFTGAALTGTATIAAETDSEDVVVIIADDTAAEEAETFTFTIANPAFSITGRTDTPVTLEATPSEMVTIARSDTPAPAPTAISLAAGEASGYDADRSVHLTWVAPTGVTQTGYLIRYRTLPAPGETTAWADVTDYETDPAATSHTIVELDANTVYEVQITTLADDYIDNWTAASPVSVTTAASITATIAGAVVDEGSTAMLTVALTGPRSVQVEIPVTPTVNVTADDTYDDAEAADFDATVVTATIQAGNTSVDISLPTDNDEIVEARETYIATLGMPTSGDVEVTDTPAVISIDDDDTAQVTLAVDLTTAVEGDTRTFTFTLDETVTHDVTVDWAIAGTNVTAGDYDTVPTGGTQTVTFPAGGTGNTQTLQILIVDDTLTEVEEVFTLTMSNPTVVLPGRTDEAITLETDTTETVTVAANDSAAPVPVDGSATAGVAGPMAGDTRRDVDRAATVTWMPPASPDVTVTGYGFRFAVDPDPTVGSLGTPADDAWMDGGSTTDTTSDPLSNVVRGLSPATQYIIQVAARATGRGDAWSDGVEVTTGAAITSSITSAAAATIAEGDPTTVTVVLSGPRSEQVTIPFVLTGVDETADFDPVGPFMAVFEAGAITTDVTFTTDNDDLVEANEEMVATLGSATGQGAVEPSSTATTAVTVTITDDDTATLSLSAGSSAATEGGTVTLTFTLSNAASVAIGLPWTVTGTGVESGDYSLSNADGTQIVSPNPIIIDAGETTKDVTFTVVDDTLMEAEEMMVFAVTGIDYTLAGRTDPITLATDPTNVTITVEANDLPAPIPAMVELEAGIAGPMTGDPRRDTDRSLTVSWEVATQAGATITGYGIRWVENPADDMDPDDGIWDGTAVVTVDNTMIMNGDPLSHVITGLDAGTTYRVQVTTRAEGLGDNWTGPQREPQTVLLAEAIVASITTTMPTISEDADALVQVTLSGRRSETVTIPLTLAGSTVDADYTDARPETVDIPAGMTSVDLNFVVEDDDLVEDNENLMVTLETPTAGEVELDQTARLVTITLSDNDEAALSVDVNSSTAVEGDTGITFTLTLTKAVAVDVMVDWTISGTGITTDDYRTSATSPATIDAGETTLDIVIDIYDDTSTEAEENLIFGLSNLAVNLPGRTGAVTLEATPSETVTIAMNDAANPEVPNVRVEAGIEGTISTDPRRDTDRSLTVSWDAPTGAGIPTITGYRVRFAVDPDPDGSLDLEPTEDDWQDGGRTSDGNTLSHEISDLDNENFYVVQVTAIATGRGDNWSDSVKASTGEAITVGFSVATLSISEGDTGQVEVVLSGARSEEVTVQIVSAEDTADSTDFTAISETVTFAAGEVSQTVDVVTSEDTSIESNELFTLTLSSVTGEVTLGEATLTVTIANDDVSGPVGPIPQPQPQPQPSPPGGTGDTPPPDTPTFTDSMGNTHETNIGQLAEMGITRGCNPPANTRFCPDRAVTRAEMATFMVRAFGYEPFAQDLFTDDDGNVHESNINALANAGVTLGCNPPTNDRFCPDRAVTRAEMATFLVRALDLDDSNASFDDTSGSVHESNISRLAGAAITRGCNPPANTDFCPDRAVTRAEMATFLVRAIALSNN